MSFIVSNETLGVPCILLHRSNSVWKSVPPDGILLNSPFEVSSFADRRSARAAINRTLRYFKTRDGRQHEFRIVCLVSAPGTIPTTSRRAIGGTCLTHL